MYVSIQCFLKFGGGLTVDSDIYSLNICINIVDGCAFIRPCSLSGDRWDFQVLIVWCQVPYERSHAQSGRKWRWTFRVNAMSQQLWPRLLLSHSVSLLASGKVIVTLVHGEEGVKCWLWTFATIIIHLVNWIYVCFWTVMPCSNNYSDIW